jgi:uncharacterized membrane protein YedE/YeeE
MKYLVSFVSGLIFAAGLVVGGMTQPSKVVGFLDFFGNWDPSLAFVMGGAVLAYSVMFRLILKKTRPFFEPKFHLPTRTDLDWRLVAGGGLFGVGWGLAGYCPGPGLTAAASLSSPALVFVGAMVVGMFLFALFDKAVANVGAGANAPESNDELVGARIHLPKES